MFCMAAKAQLEPPQDRPRTMSIAQTALGSTLYEAATPLGCWKRLQFIWTVMVPSGIYLHESEILCSDSSKAVPLCVLANDSLSQSMTVPRA